MPTGDFNDEYLDKTFGLHAHPNIDSTPSGGYWVSPWAQNEALLTYLDKKPTLKRYASGYGAGGPPVLQGIWGAALEVIALASSVYSSLHPGHSEIHTGEYSGFVGVDVQRKPMEDSNEYEYRAIVYGDQFLTVPHLAESSDKLPSREVMTTISVQGEEGIALPIFSNIQIGEFPGVPTLSGDRAFYLDKDNFYDRFYETDQLSPLE